MISFDEAVARTIAIAAPFGREEVSIAEAHRRVLAAPVEALVASPPRNVSAMDGYAVRDADLAVPPARLKVVAKAFAGSDAAPTLAPGECARIFTGGPVPAGADRVVVQEEVRRDGDAAIFPATAGAGRHIRLAGSDFRVGDLLLPAGVKLGPRQMVAVAAADLDRITIWRRPSLMVLSTGDELAPPGSARSRPGTIPESLSVGVAGLAEEWGGRFVGAAALPDDLAEMKEAAALSIRDADLIVVTGGASVGDRDFARQMFEEQSLDLVFSKVAIKPGKPVWLGRAGGRIIIGLPGNPTSAMVTARLFLAPLLAGCTGQDPASALRWRQLALIDEIGPVGTRETFARGVAEDDRVRILSNQDSSAQKVLAQCDLLVRLRAGTPGIAVGGQVDVLDF